MGIEERKEEKKRKIKLQVFLAKVGILVLSIIMLAIGVGQFRKAMLRAEQKKAKMEWQQGVRDAIEAEQTRIAEEEAARLAALAARVDYALDPSKSVGTLEQSEEKVVYMTFDDGPSVNTEAVLDILDQYNVKATFFVTGLNNAYFPLIKETYDRGHTIGLHTYSHNYQEVYSSEESFFADLDRIGALVKEQIGYVPCFIRFPGGASNTISRKYTPGIMTSLSQSVLDRGYQYYDWNVSSGDGGNVNAETLIKESTGGTSNNLNILFHDANGKGSTVEGLPSVIEYYLEQGYEFRALDREAYAPHHRPNN